MPATWFIGDLHLGHKLVSELRGFATTEAHDDAIVTNWRRQVNPDDTVYVLGDLSSGARQAELTALRTLFTLPGKKRLIAGNHDSIAGIHRKPSPHTGQFRHVFEQIHDHGRIRVEGQQIMLSHYPYASQGDGPGRTGSRYDQYRLHDLGQRLIHAHTHHAHPTDGSLSGRELCVSWDAWNRLVNLGDVQKWIIE